MGEERDMATAVVDCDAIMPVAKRGRGQHGLIKNKSSLGLNPRRNPRRRCPAPGCQNKLYAFAGSFEVDSTGKVVPVKHAPTNGKQHPGNAHAFDACHCPTHQLFFHRPANQALGKELDQVCCYGCGNLWKFVSEGDQPRRDYNLHCTCDHSATTSAPTTNNPPMTNVRENPWAGASGVQGPPHNAAQPGDSVATQLHYALAAGILAFACASSAVSSAAAVTLASKQPGPVTRSPRS